GKVRFSGYRRRRRGSAVGGQRLFRHDGYPLGADSGGSLRGPHHAGALTDCCALFIPCSPDESTILSGITAVFGEKSIFSGDRMGRQWGARRGEPTKKIRRPVFAPPEFGRAGGGPSPPRGPFCVRPRFTT